MTNAFSSENNKQIVTTHCLKEKLSKIGELTDSNETFSTYSLMNELYAE